MLLSWLKAQVLFHQQTSFASKFRITNQLNCTSASQSAGWRDEELSPISESPSQALPRAEIEKTLNLCARNLDDDLILTVYLGLITEVIISYNPIV